MKHTNACRIYTFTMEVSYIQTSSYSILDQTFAFFPNIAPLNIDHMGDKHEDINIQT